MNAEKNRLKSSDETGGWGVEKGVGEEERAEECSPNIFFGSVLSKKRNVPTSEFNQFNDS